jgi:6-pyruvoyltetrahydropterin/6-carboxytetrahydropterin synthase
MYTLTVREHMMIAHSFQGEMFGPAQNLHGATYVVDVEFRRAQLDKHNVVVDIGLAGAVLKAILAEFNYKNLDEVPAFQGHNTTTEYLCKTVFERMRSQIRAGQLGDGSEALSSLKVTLHESHIAWASFEGAC